MSVHSQRGFLFGLDDENFGILGDLGCMIKIMKWTKFCNHPQPYNIQLVKEVYANLVVTTSK